MRLVLALLPLLFAAAPAFAQLHAAVLPSSRSVQVGEPATAFATIINAGSIVATGCSIAPVTSVPATFTFQTTNPATNKPTGTVNMPVDIPPGAPQSFVIALTPSAPINAEDVHFAFTCAGGGLLAPAIPGVNTLRLFADDGPVSDVIAILATPTHDGVINVDQDTVAFSMAATNVGASAGAGGPPGQPSFPCGYFKVSAVPSVAGVTTTLCRTGQAGQCLEAETEVSRTMIETGPVTFSIFVRRSGTVAFKPAENRIVVTFTHMRQVGTIPYRCPLPAASTVPVLTVGERGSTSIAVKTEP